MRFPVLAVAVFLALSLATAAQAAEIEPLKVLYDNKLDRSVVVVVYANRQYGTGWWVNEHYIVTAAHVTDYQANVPVTILHGDYESSGYVVGVDKEHDIEVIYVERPMANATILPLCERVAKGEEVLVIGYPFELLQILGDLRAASANPRAAYGTIAWTGTGEKWYLSEVQATTDEGNSGGPAVDLDTHCSLGAITFALKGEAGVLYYITNVYSVRRLLDKYNVTYTVKQNMKLTDSDDWPWNQHADSSSPSIDSEKQLYALGGAALAASIMAVLLVASGRGRRAAVVVLALGVVALALPAAHADSGNVSIAVIPLAVRDSGYDLVQCQHVKVSVKAKYYDGPLFGLFQPAEVHIGPLTARIDTGNAYLGLADRVYAVVELDGEKVAEKELTKIWIGGGSYDFGLVVDCSWSDELSCSVSTDKGLVWSGTIKPSPYGYYDIFWDYADEPTIDSEWICDTATTTVTGIEPAPDRPTNQDNYKNQNNEDGLEKYMLYGVGGLAALSLLLAAARGGSVVVVSGGGKRGMVQLLGVIVLAAALGGAALAWKLRGLFDGGGSGDSSLLLAGIGILVAIVFLMLLLGRRSQVIVVEGR
ncbi:serine protease [Pyrodictium abyssi]|uniref:Serine protease n=1 Tax=Pyrodictium abyssi TaxID=54256 RepID=A0ABM8IYL3_9CREN|nr:hypothetical protein PABY_08140 [Pyrodictium abyssi]